MNVGAWELVERFARCGNYPKDEAGIEALVAGLIAVSDRTGVPMATIVDRCVTESQWCPTDYDLLTVAREVRGPEKPRPSKCPHQLCDGSGWRETYVLWTRKGDGQFAYIDKKIISQTEYDELWRKVDWKTQEVYAGRFRCKCHPPREIEVKEPKRRGA